MTPPPLPEKSQFVDQKKLARFEKTINFIVDNSLIFSATGVIAWSWRYYRSKRIGPYFRLVFRQQNRQKSIYLGRSEEFAQFVRDLLINLQYARSTRRLRTKIRKSLRMEKTRLQNYSKSNGYYMKGFEFRKLKSN
jgi:hypothetical protein